MAFKLSKSEIARRDQYIEKLREMRGKVEDQVAIFNEAVTELRTPLDEALTEYAELFEEVRGWAEDIGSEAQAAIDDKSERWQDGDTGQAAQAWATKWSEWEPETLEITWPEDLSIDDIEDAADSIGELPEELEE
jgi:cell division GTPase FtsZ